MSSDALNELAAIFREKHERRARLAALSIDEKVEIIEKMQELGQTMVAARRSLREGTSARGRAADEDSGMI